MRPFSDFYAFILPFAPSAPDPLIERFTRQSATEFCRRTRSWRDVQEIDVMGDESEIVCAPQFASIFEIEKAHFKHTADTRWRELEAFPYSELDQMLLDEAATDQIFPRAISQSGFNSVIVSPRAIGTLRVSSFLKPAADAEYAPDYLFDNYLAEIADGALSYLLMVPDQPYTNPNLGALKAALFNEACDRHFGMNIKGQHRAPTRMKSSFV